MRLKDIMQAGHAPTLFRAFLYFDMSFMVWVVLGPLGVHIARDLGLSPVAAGYLTAGFVFVVSMLGVARAV